MKKKIEQKNMRQCRHCAEYFNERTLKGATHLAGCRIYNGWKNYETWCVSLWIDNEQGTHKYWRSAARDALESANETGNVHNFTGSYGKPESYARTALARQLKEEIESSDEVPTEGMIADLVGGAFCEVDWYEIAGNMIDSVEVSE